MGREPCTRQPRRHPAFARIATLAVAHARRTHCAPAAEGDLAQSAAHCLRILRVGVDFDVVFVVVRTGNSATDSILTGTLDRLA